MASAKPTHRELEGLADYKREERERVRSLADRFTGEGGLLGELADRMRRDGQRALRDVYRTLYADEPTVASILGNCQRRGLRVASGSVVEFLTRTEEMAGPTIAYLRDDFRGNWGSQGHTMERYYGLGFQDPSTGSHLVDLLELTHSANLVLMMGSDAAAYDRQLYARFFAEWERRDPQYAGLPRYPPYANRLQAVIGLSAGPLLHELKDKVKERLEGAGVKLSERVHIEDPDVYDAPVLPSQTIGEYFPEKLAEIELLKGGPVAETVVELLEEHARTGKRRHLVDAVDLTFSYYEVLPDFFLRSRGSPVVMAVADFDRASRSFEAAVRRIEAGPSVRIGELLRLVTGAIPFLSFRGIVSRLREALRLPMLVGAGSNQRERTARVLLDRLPDQRAAVSESMDGIATEVAMRAGQQDPSLEDDVVRDLDERFDALAAAYWNAFRYAPSRLVKETALSVGVGFSTALLFTDLSILKAYAASELSDAALARVFDRGALDEMVGLGIAGYFGDLTVPIDPWTAGNADPIAV